MAADQAQALRGLVEAHERRQRDAERAAQPCTDPRGPHTRGQGPRPGAAYAQQFHFTGSVGPQTADQALGANGNPTLGRHGVNGSAPNGSRGNGFGANHQFASPSLTPRLAQAVAITSGKGGVGKTTVALNLAVQLTRMDQRVVLLDADLGTANVDVMCNRMPSNRLAQVIDGRASLEDVMVEGPGGFRLIPGGSGLSQVANLNQDQRRRLIRQMQGLEAESDIMLIDTSAGVGENVLGFTLAADQVLVVTSPEPTAITDAYAVIKMICQQSLDGSALSLGFDGQAAFPGEDRMPEIRLVVNMARDKEEAGAVFDRIDSVCRRFLNLRPTYGGYVTNDPRVITAIRSRKPFTLEHPSSRGALDVARIAQSLTPAERLAADKSPGLVSRLVRWFGR